MIIVEEWAQPCYQLAKFKGHQKSFVCPKLATVCSQHLLLDQVNRESRQLAHLNPLKKKVLLLVSTLTVGQQTKWLGCV